MTVPADRTFLLPPMERNVEVFRVSDEELAVHAGALLSLHEAEQLALGIRAVLSNQFDRACTEDYLRFDLERRTRVTPTLSPRKESAPDHTPTLGDL